MTPTIGKYRDEQSVKRPQYLLQYCWKRWQDRVRASGRPHRCRFARQMRGIRAKGCKVGDKRMTADEPRSDDSSGSAPQPAATPVPRPGPRPGPRPVPRPTSYPVGAHPPSDPHRFGRIDDDGTVWLVSASGERIVGSWQAGDPEAAFAHFGRRFDDLSTEIMLMDERLASGTGDARKIKAHAIALAETLPTACVLGDVDALADRLTSIRDRAEVIAAADRSRREEHRAAQTARKEALAAEAEELAANATQWKVAGDRLRAILDEWKTISGVDRKVDDALWKRYSTARDTFNRRRGSHFAELDRERSGVRQSKERLCERAEELSESTDWTATSAEFRKLLADWKAAGRASKDVDDALWRRFKAAQDSFFTLAMPPPPRRRPSCEPMPTPRRRCWPKRSGSTRQTTRPLEQRCGRSPRSGTRSARCRGSGPRSWSGDYARSRKRCEKPAKRIGPTRRRGPAPSSSAPGPSSLNTRPRRQQRPVAPRKPTRRRRTPNNGGSGPRQPPTR